MPYTKFNFQYDHISETLHTPQQDQCNIPLPGVIHQNISNTNEKKIDMKIHSCTYEVNNIKLDFMWQTGISVTKTCAEHTYTVKEGRFCLYMSWNKELHNLSS